MPKPKPEPAPWTVKRVILGARVTANREVGKTYRDYPEMCLRKRGLLLPMTIDALMKGLTHDHRPEDRAARRRRERAIARELER